MSKTPHYKLLHQQLKKEILEGQYKKGELIPSENQLSNEYGINRMTVRKALEGLVNEGLIAKKAGKGSIVLENRRSLGLLSFKGFTEVVGPTEHSAKTIFLKQPFKSQWPKPFFYDLTAEQVTNQCIKLERLRIVDEDPVMLENTWIENRGLSDLEENPLVENSLFKTLHLNHNIEVINLDQDIRAVVAPSDVSNLLNMKVNHPVIHIYRKYTTTLEEFYIYSSLYCNTEKYTLGNNF